MAGKPAAPDRSGGDMDHDANAVAREIVEMFDGVDAVEASGDWFFFCDPGRNLEPDRRFPFATIVTADRYDTASDLNRPGVFRLNVGVSPATFRRLFGAATDGQAAPDVDFTALDRILPHPVYGKMFWICVLDPSAATFARLRPLLAEAYARAVDRPAPTRAAPRS
jgi:hypothetical protein